MPRRVSAQYGKLAPQQTLTAYMGRERSSLPQPQLLPLGLAAVAFTLALALRLDLLADEITPHGHDQ